jgi:alpha-L-rhamnosidase
VNLHVFIPSNTTATIYVPSNDATTVRERGKPAAESAGLKFQRMDTKTKSAVYAALSGDYAFSFTVGTRGN